MLIDPKKTLFINRRGPIGAAVKEAPVDGKSYIRKDGEWSEAIVSEGGSGFSGNYNDLINKPNIPSDISDLTDNNNLLNQGNSFSIPEVKTPINIYPLDMDNDVIETPELIGSTFYSLYGMSMSASQWQIAIDVEFNTIVLDTGDIVGDHTSFILTPGVLSTDTTYYWRVRYKDLQGEYSNWSIPTTFHTESTFSVPSYISTPTTTPNLGEAFEGGFYAGMIWNQLTQSEDLKELKTGRQFFNVPDMTGNPIVYIGQQIEIRSRTEPNNKFICTVLFAGNTRLLVDVTNVDGNGTFNDWSVMGKFRIIVSPRADGEVSQKIKNSPTTLPIECRTLTEGFVATESMKNSDSSLVYPAAHWARSLNIGGYTDWYIPSRDELELCYRAFKPSTLNNAAVALRELTDIDYKVNGSYGDVVNNVNGTNNNSIPVNNGYSLINPTQTTASSFQVGGSNEFTDNLGTYYLSSSEYSITNVYQIIFSKNNANNGRQLGSGKSTNRVLRAVRRSAI